MKNLAVVNLRDTKISDAALSHLTQCGKLKKLEVSECSQPGITDLGCEHLAKIQSLENINLWLSKVSDDGLKPLRKLVKLTALNLDNTAITDAGTETIAQMKQLTWLHLGQNKNHRRLRADIKIDDQLNVLGHHQHRLIPTSQPRNR